MCPNFAGPFASPPDEQFQHQEGRKSKQGASSACRCAVPTCDFRQRAAIFVHFSEKYQYRSLGGCRGPGLSPQPSKIWGKEGSTSWCPISVWGRIIVSAALRTSRKGRVCFCTMLHPARQRQQRDPRLLPVPCKPSIPDILCHPSPTKYGGRTLCGI